MAARFLDCPSCGARIIESRWTTHQAEHDRGELPVLSPEEIERVRDIAHSLAIEDFFPEDCLPEPDPETAN